MNIPKIFGTKKISVSFTFPENTICGGLRELFDFYYFIKDILDISNKKKINGSTGLIEDTKDNFSF